MPGLTLLNFSSSPSVGATFWWNGAAPRLLPHPDLLIHTLPLGKVRLQAGSPGRSGKTSLAEYILTPSLGPPLQRGESKTDC